MTINIVLDKGAKAPFKAHSDDAGYDLFIHKFCKNENEKIFVIRENSTMMIDTGVHIDVPKNHVALVLPRSSSSKNGLLVHTGVIDSGYTGSIKITVNTLNEPIKLMQGDRIAQLVIIPIVSDQLNQVPNFDYMETDRGAGGFGSSGK